MALIEPDFSDVQDSVTPGTYKVRVVGAEPGAWATGTKYVNWRLETFGESESKNNGRSIFFKTPTHGKGAFRLADLYRAATKQQLAGAFDTEQLLGKEVQVTVVDGTDKEGNPSGYTEVKAVKPI